MLKFDAESHTYTFDGQQVPNVTRLLEPLSQYAGVPRDTLDQAAARGHYVHKCCELMLWGTLDWSSVKEDLKGYVKGFEKFLVDTKFDVEFVEERVFHQQLKYAGTIDLIGMLPPIKRCRNPHRAELDIKTTFKLLKSVGPQTWAYEDAWHSQHKETFPIDARYALQLKKEGSYFLEPLTSPNDKNIFISCLNIYNFMRA